MLLAPLVQPLLHSALKPASAQEPAMDYFLLMEDGNYILMEDGSFIKLE